MKTNTLSRALLLALGLSISAAGNAWHGGGYHGGGYHGGGYHGGGYHGGGYHGGGYHGGGYHGGGWGWGSGWGRSGVVIGVPIVGGYYPGYRSRCSYVQQCYPNGNCVQRKICR